MNFKAKTKTGAAIKATIIKATIIIIIILTMFANCGGDKNLKEDQDKFIMEHNCTPDVITCYPSGELVTKYSCDKGYSITTSSMSSLDPRSIFFKNSNADNNSSSGFVTGMVVSSLMNSGNNNRPAWRSSSSRSYSSSRGRR